MTSPKQSRANRENSKRSTGPKPGAGKTRASRNSLKHGLTSREIVIGNEDPGQFEALLRGLEVDFKPTTTIERELVHRLAGLLWRLRRVPVFETSIMRARIEEIEKRDLTSYLSAMEREQLRELQDLLWREQEATKRLHALIDKETGGGGAAFAVTLEPRYYERLEEFRKLVATEPRLPEQPQEKNQEVIQGLSLIKDSENHDTLGKLSRYEAGLLNAMTRTLNLLHSLRNSGLLSNRRVLDQELK